MRENGWKKAKQERGEAFKSGWMVLGMKDIGSKTKPMGGEG